MGCRNLFVLSPVEVISILAACEGRVVIMPAEGLIKFVGAILSLFTFNLQLLEPRFEPIPAGLGDLILE